MLPISMKKPVWLAPICVVNMTMGMFLLLAVTAPWFTPDLKEKAARRGLTAIIMAIAAINIVGPVALLWYHCRVSAHADRGTTGEENQ